jgi:hypothetical protein
MSGAMAVVLRSKDEIRDFVAAAVQMKSPQLIKAEATTMIGGIE